MVLEILRAFVDVDYEEVKVAEDEDANQINSSSKPPQFKKSESLSSLSA